MQEVADAAGLSMEIGLALIEAQQVAS